MKKIQELAQKIAKGEITKEEATKQYRGISDTILNRLPTFEETLKKMNNFTTWQDMMKRAENSTSLIDEKIYKYVLLLEHSKGTHWCEFLIDIPLNMGDSRLEEMIKILEELGLQEVKIIRFIEE